MNQSYMFLSILLLLYIYIRKNTSIEHFSLRRCQYNQSKNLLEILKKYSISSETVIPCSYDNLDEESEYIPKNSKYIFFIENADYLVAKNGLYYFMRNYYGEPKVFEYLPQSWLITEIQELQKLKDDYYKKKRIYILKKNIQRQQDILITDSYDDIVKASTENYIICQELLQDPFLVKKRKINIRRYIVMSIFEDTINAYLFHDGFMYYTKDFYEPMSLDTNKNITTGYIDRSVYETHPLTYKDFIEYLETNDYNSKILEENTIQFFKYLIQAYRNVFLTQKRKFYSKTCFQIFGVDIAVDKNLNVKCMELNKGPDLDSKDERDGQLKKSLLEHTFRLIGVLPKNEETKRFFIPLM